MGDIFTPEDLEQWELLGHELKFLPPKDRVIEVRCGCILLIHRAFIVAGERFNKWNFFVKEVLRECEYAEYGNVDGLVRYENGSYSFRQSRPKLGTRPVARAG